MSGTVEARESDLAFQVPGRIVRLLADEGATVEAGQVIAELIRAITNLPCSGRARRRT